MRRNSGIIGKKQTKTVTSASGIHDTFDNYNSEIDGSWPQVKEFVSVSPNTGNVTEGSTSTFNVTTNGFVDGETLYYSITTSGGVSASDFSGGLTGSFTITSNSGSFDLQPVSDGVSETETFTIEFRLNSSSGEKIGESGTYTMVNTTASPEFNWRYYAYGSGIGTITVKWVLSNGTEYVLRSVSGQQHTSSGSTWNSYTENLSSYSGTTGRIYFMYRTGNSFYNDPQLDNMELDATTSGTINLDPGTSTGRGRWQKYNGYTTSYVSPYNSTFFTIPIGTSTSNYWNYDSGGTPSSSTGGSLDADGSSSGYYLYFEGSSPNNSSNTRYYWVRMTQDYTLL